MKNLNKMIVLLLIFGLVFGLVGCGTASTGSKEKDQDKTAKQEEKADSAKKKESKSKAAEAKATEKSGKEEAQASSETQATETKQDQASTAKSQSATITQQPTNTATVAQPKAQPVSKPKPVETATISIIGPENKVILSATKVEIKAEDSVMDILLRVADQKGIEVDYKNKYGSPYVEGIDGYYEGDYPGQSGWTYKLNGVLVQKSAGDAYVKSGDKIVWEYVGD